MRDAYIIGVGMTRFAKHWELGIKDLAAEAYRKTLEDAGIDKDDIEAAWFSNSGWGSGGGQHSIRGQVALRPVGLDGIPFTNVENACASGSTALHGAWLGVASGAHECTLAMGVEKMAIKLPPGTKRSFEGFWAGTDVETVQEQMAGMAATAKAMENIAPVNKDDKGPGKDRSVFMDFYSLAARGHIARYGTTQEDIAAIAAKNHFHSSMNPNAQYTKDMSVEEVLAGREVSWPLTVPMCAPIGDGGAAAIVVSADYLKKLTSARPVKILASLMGSCSDHKPEELDKSVSTRLSRKAYEIAGIGPEDVDLAEVHDATAFGELHQTEVLGFCEIGEGGRFAASGATKLGGKIPVNTSGGLESRGHPIGASGMGMTHEIVTQLRHEAGDRQVENCRLGMVENGGGSLGGEEASMGLHLLERVSN